MTHFTRLILRLPAPKPAIIFNERFVAARYEETCYEKYIFAYVLVREALLTDDVEVAKSTVVQDIRP